MKFGRNCIQTSLRVAPSRQRRKGPRNIIEKLAPKICFRSEFLDRNLCEALCQIIYNDNNIQIICFSSLLITNFLSHVLRQAKKYSRNTSS